MIHRIINRKRYSNLNNDNTFRNWRDLRRWKKETRGLEKDYSFTISRALLVDPKFLQTNRTETTITWIGHSTFLIQMAGLNIVTDPVWAESMGFKKRLVPPGIPMEQMPEIDLVLISHAHYDHLHFGSIRDLKGDPQFFVPEGLRPMFRRRGFTKVTEFSWWDEMTIGEVQFTFVPSKHWTRRTLWDTNRSHWGGWVIHHLHEKPEEKHKNDDLHETLYFVGDTGYFDGFAEVGKRFDIDVVMMPIGAYDPEWFMSEHHVNPENAVQGYIDCGAEVFIPMHYGTFKMADDTAREALDRLQAEWERRKLNPSCLDILQLGESLIR